MPYRDHKKFKEMVKECGVECAHNEFVANGISYMDLKQLETLWKDSEKQKLLAQSVLLIDEYDWLIFDDAKPQAIKDRIEKLRQFSKIIGFSGSKLNRDEDECLAAAFGIKVSTFPLMKDLNKNLVTKYEDIIETQVKPWKEAVLAKASEFAQKVPVIIVANSKECELLTKLFNGTACTDLS